MKPNNDMYVGIYHFNGVTDFAKAYKYIMEYAVSSEAEVAVREIKLGLFEIAVYCPVIRHLRITEYFENVGIDWN